MIRVDMIDVCSQRGQLLKNSIPVQAKGMYIYAHKKLLLLLLPPRITAGCLAVQTGLGALTPEARNGSPSAKLRDCPLTEP